MDQWISLDLAFRLSEKPSTPLLVCRDLGILLVTSGGGGRGDRGEGEGEGEAVEKNSAASEGDQTCVADTWPRWAGTRYTTSSKSRTIGS